MADDYYDPGTDYPGIVRQAQREEELLNRERDLLALLAEGLRLYDWCEELAKEEEALEQPALWHRDHAERRRLGKALDKKLRQYGTEKAAWWKAVSEAVTK